jgi:hypothetical protein
VLYITGKPNILDRLCGNTECIDRSLVKVRSAIEYAVATHENGKHEDAEIVVLILFGITKTFRVNEYYVDCRAILSLYFARFVPDPKTLGAGVHFMSDFEAVRLLDELVEQVGFAAAKQAGNRYHSYIAFDSFNEVEGLLVDISFYSACELCLAMVMTY